MTENTDVVLELADVSQAYDGQLVVRNLSLSLRQGEIGCLLGASGCGKTTVLRIIAGFEPVLCGTVRLKGVTVSSPGFSLPPARRKVGMVFQDYALFPHLTIFDNVGFGLRTLERAQRTPRIHQALELVGLFAEHGKYPHEISGGQQQRVALARALAPRPQLLLLDEPFSNLDVTLRERLSMEVRDILKENGTTALFVTHNQHEAFAVADRIGVMHNGEIQQWDSGHNLYHQPLNPRIAEFVGEGSLIRGVVKDRQRVETGLGLLQGRFNSAFPAGSRVKLLIRPEDILHTEDGPLSAEVLRRNFRGASVLYSLRLDSGDRIQALVPSHCQHQPGERIGIRPDVRELVMFPEH